MNDETPESKAAYFRDVAAKLREISARLQFDERRKAQLLALAEGFERFARQVERTSTTDR